VRIVSCYIQFGVISTKVGCDRLGMLSLSRSVRPGHHRLLKEAELNRVYIAAGLRSADDEDS